MMLEEREDIMPRTFRGGIHVPHNKNTKDIPIKNFPAPKYVAIPLQQHIGAPAQPLVKVGDAVKMGQTIGDFKEGLSCPVHASISGVVKEIQMRPSYTGYGKTAHIIIENDFSDELCDDIKPYGGDISKLTSDEITDIVRKAGISGMGGASFPTYAKIKSAIGKAKEVIINCAECEPYITENHRIMLESPKELIEGAKILMQACGVQKATLAVEDNKKDAARALAAVCPEGCGIYVKLLKTKYPQGDERQLMYVLNGVQMPAGKLPADVGCVIFNAETTLSVYQAVKFGMPLIRTVVTVDGDAVNTPCNLRIPLGVSFGDVLDHCGGVKENINKIIHGGPMMGQAQWDYNAVVMKNTSAILALSEQTPKIKEPACIHCGKCISVCPMHLMPNYLATFSKAEDSENAEQFNILSCVECGSCTYTCPGGVPIVQYIRTQKGKIIASKKAAAAKQKESEGKKQ